jgi:hypothetical protein
MATDIVADTHSSLLVVTFCRSDVLEDIKSGCSTAIWDRLNGGIATIKALTWEQMVRIYIRRLESEPALRAIRETTNDTYWPLGEPFLHDIRQKHPYDVTPRHLLIACREEFDRRQNQDADPPLEAIDADGQPGNPGPVPTSGAPANGATGERGNPNPEPAPDASSSLEAWLNQEWERRRKEAHDRLDGIEFALVMTQGLTLLLEAMRCPVTLNRPIPADYECVNLVYSTARSQGTAKPLGISLCDHNVHRLPPRLKKLEKQWGQARRHSFLGELVVLRPARSRTTERAV